VLSQLGQQDITTFEARRDLNNQLTSPHGKRSESGIAFVTTGVLVMMAPEPDDAWPPHPWFLLGNSSHESNQSLGVIPLLLVRDGSNVTLGADVGGFGLEYRHMHLRAASFRRLTNRASAAARHWILTPTAWSLPRRQQQALVRPQAAGAADVGVDASATR